MSGSVCALVRKELAQHRAAFIVLLSLLGLSLALMSLSSSISASRMSYLEMVPGYVRGPVSIAAFLLAGRLVAAEYYARTQRFVEALPIRRVETTLVKFLIGLAFVWTAAGAGIGVAVWRAVGEGGMEHSWIAIIVARVAAATFALWCFAFATGYLGRARVALIVLSVALLVIAEIHTDIELERFGPIALTDPRFLPFEYEIVPVRALLESVGVGVACLVVAGVLTAVREGSVVEALARPMSHRESTFVLVLCLLALYGLFFASAAREPEPFRFTGPFVERSEVVPVEVMYLAPENRAAAAALLEQAERWYAVLRADLGPAAEIPEVFITLSPSRRHQDVRTTRLERDSIVLSANFLPGPGWDPTELGTHVVHQVLSAMNLGRLFVEPRHWLADGASRHWAIRGMPAGVQARDRQRFAAQALAAGERSPVDASTVATWDRVLERLGDELSLALAYDGVRFLADRHGEEVFAAMARELLARPADGDLRDWLFERRNALPRAFERRTGTAWGEFVAAWRADLVRRRAASEQPAMDSVHATVRALVDASGERSLRFEVESVSALPADVECKLLHAPIDVYDRPLGVREATESRFTWASPQRSARRDLGAVYGPGERVFAALECRLPWLGASARLAAERLIVP